MTVRLKVVDGAEARPRRKHPPWLRVPFPGGATFTELRDRVSELRLHTVCQSASCPNIGECWNNRALTIMILGNICTRSCRFCDVATGRPLPVDEGEPDRVAEILGELRLTHTVITSVDRDDLKDGGASIWARTLDACHARAPWMTVEVLVPDFKGDLADVDTVLAANPDVFAHNLETVPRLSREVRVQARYDRSYAVLEHARRSGAITKTGIMLGLGETLDEVREVIDQLGELGLTSLTLGQYLSPSKAPGYRPLRHPGGVRGPGDMRAAAASRSRLRPARALLLPRGGPGRAHLRHPAESGLRPRRLREPRRRVPAAT